MTPDSEILRGFGMVFGAGGVRNWYVGADGIRRWADNDQPVDTPTPEAPEPLDGNPAPTQAAVEPMEDES